MKNPIAADTLNLIKRAIGNVGAEVRESGATAAIIESLLWVDFVPLKPTLRLESTKK